MQSSGGISILTRRFGLVALVLVGGIATPSLAVGAQGVNQVRDVGVSWVAGPLRLTPGGSAQARLWLPAAQQGFKVTFLGDGGDVLGAVEVDTPTPAGALFEVVYEARYDGRALSITTARAIRSSSAKARRESSPSSSGSGGPAVRPVGSRCRAGLWRPCRSSTAKGRPW
jgi:hypothetical protein